MNLHTVDTDRLNHPGAVEYFTRNAHRLAAVRALLQTLSLPFPDWAQREPSGRAATSRKIIAAFREDHPETLHQLTMRHSREAAARLPGRDGGERHRLSSTEQLAALEAAGIDPLSL